MRFRLDLEYGGYDEREKVHTYPDNSFINVRNVLSTVAPHVCEYCKTMIAVGSQSTRYAGRDERVGFYCYHVCSECG